MRCLSHVTNQTISPLPSPSKKLYKKKKKRHSLRARARDRARTRAVRTQGALNVFVRGEVLPTRLPAFMRTLFKIVCPCSYILVVSCRLRTVNMHLHRLIASSLSCITRRLLIPSGPLPLPTGTGPVPRPDRFDPPDTEEEVIGWYRGPQRRSIRHIQCRGPYLIST